MNRRSVLARAAAVVAIGLLAAVQGAVAADSAPAKPTVIYVSAEDCTTCKQWERANRPSFEASRERKAVEWREVRVHTLVDIREKARWPADLEWLRVQLPKDSTPRFYLIQGDRVLAKGDGIDGWTGTILPRIKALAVAKSG